MWVGAYALVFEGVLDALLHLADAFGGLVLLELVEVVLLAFAILGRPLLSGASVGEDELLALAAVCMGGSVHCCCEGVIAKSEVSWGCWGRVEGVAVCSWKSSEPK